MSLAFFGLDWTMQFAYAACAAAGGTVLVLQTLLMMLGVGDGHPGMDLHHGGEAGGAHEGSDHPDQVFSLFSIRAIAAFLTFFGLTGWLGTSKDWDSTVTLVAAVLAGLAMMVLVAWMMKMQSKLQSQGNLEPKNAVGLSGRVYLRIPAANGGFGKVQVKLQGRTAEFSACTAGAELATGALVRLTRMQTPDTFVRAPWPGMTNATAIIHTAPAVGARFVQYTAEFEPQGELAAAAVQRFVYVLEGEVVANRQTLGPGGYAVAPSTDTRRGVVTALRKKLQR